MHGSGIARTVAKPGPVTLPGVTGLVVSACRKNADLVPVVQNEIAQAPAHPDRTFGRPQ